MYSHFLLRAKRTACCMYFIFPRNNAYVRFANGFKRAKGCSRKHPLAIPIRRSEAAVAIFESSVSVKL